MLLLLPVWSRTRADRGGSGQDLAAPRVTRVRIGSSRGTRHNHNLVPNNNKAGSLCDEWIDPAARRWWRWGVRTRGGEGGRVRSAELWSSARESGPADGRGVLECGVPECPGGSSHWQGRGWSLDLKHITCIVTYCRHFVRWQQTDVVQNSVDPCLVCTPRGLVDQWQLS